MHICRRLYYKLFWHVWYTNIHSDHTSKESQVTLLFSFCTHSHCSSILIPIQSVGSRSLHLCLTASKMFLILNPIPTGGVLCRVHMHTTRYRVHTPAGVLDHGPGNTTGDGPRGAALQSLTAPKQLVRVKFRGQHFPRG